jgi:hypothetical protein
VDVTVAELRLEAFLPADQATAAILTNLDGRQRGEAELQVGGVALHRLPGLCPVCGDR